MEEQSTNERSDGDDLEECDCCSSVSSSSPQWEPEWESDEKEWHIKDKVARDVLISLGMSSLYENAGINSGKFQAWSLSQDDEEYVDVCKYATRHHIHPFGSHIKITSVLRISINAHDPQNFDASQHPGKLRMMLFHGTSEETVVSILQNGMVLPEGQAQTLVGALFPNRSVSKRPGLMFGPGIYFADRASKSVKYCVKTEGISEGFEGYLFLCDVLLGNVCEAYHCQPSCSAPPKGFDSVKGVGRFIPDSSGEKVIEGCVWPLGRTMDNKNLNAEQLLCNEYVVYDPAQVKPKYLLKFQRT